MVSHAIKNVTEGLCPYHQHWFMAMQTVAFRTPQILRYAILCLKSMSSPQGAKNVSLMSEIAENLDIMIMNGHVSLIERPCFDHYCVDHKMIV